MSEDNVVHVVWGNLQDVKLVDELADSIKELIYSYSERMLLATAIGTLETVKAEILAEQMEEIFE